jgi:hypothetical protein
VAIVAVRLLGDITPVFWEHATIQQLMRLVTRPRYESQGGYSGSSRSSGDRYGCCPSCHTFVRIGAADDPAGDATCPSCRRPIRELDTLWPSESKKNPEKLET